MLTYIYIHAYIHILSHVVNVTSFSFNAIWFIRSFISIHLFISLSVFNMSQIYILKVFPDFLAHEIVQKKGGNFQSSFINSS